MGWENETGRMDYKFFWGRMLSAVNPTAKLFRTEQVRPVSRDAGIPAEHLDASSYFSQDAESHEEAYGGGRHPIQGPEAGLHG